MIRGVFHYQFMSLYHITPTRRSFSTTAYRMNDDDDSSVTSADSINENEREQLADDKGFQIDMYKDANNNLQYCRDLAKKHDNTEPLTTEEKGMLDYVKQRNFDIYEEDKSFTQNIDREFSENLSRIEQLEQEIRDLTGDDNYSSDNDSVAPTYEDDSNDEGNGGNNGGNDGSSDDEDNNGSGGTPLDYIQEMESTEPMDIMSDE